MGGGGGKKKKHPGKAILAGGIAGGLEVCCTYPTEFVKTQLQLYEDKARLGAVRVAKDTIKNEGFLGLYRGLSPLLTFSIPKVAVRFFAFEMGKNALMAPDGSLTTGRTLLAGLTAGVAEAVLVVTPMETIKTKFIHDQLSRPKAERHYRGLAHGVKTIVKTEGLAGTYKGLSATVMKQGSNQAIRWVVLTKVKEWFAGGTDTSKLTVWHTIAASFAAGTASVYGNTPIDVVKSRMQGLQAAKYKNTLDCFMSILRNEGPAALYKGATARLTRVCLDVAIVMVLYEQISKALDLVWKTE